MPEQAKRGLRALLSVAAAGLALWIALRFLLPWLGPFLLALALASLLEPGVRALIRHGWRRGLAAALLTLLLLGLLFWGLAELGGRCLSAAASLTRELPRLMQAMARSPRLSFYNSFSCMLAAQKSRSRKQSRGSFLS